MEIWRRLSGKAKHKGAIVPYILYRSTAFYNCIVILWAAVLSCLPTIQVGIKPAVVFYPWLLLLYHEALSPNLLSSFL